MAVAGPSDRNSAEGGDEKPAEEGFPYADFEEIEEELSDQDQSVLLKWHRKLRDITVSNSKGLFNYLQEFNISIDILDRLSRSRSSKPMQQNIKSLRAYIEYKFNMIAESSNIEDEVRF